jgi:uncharacterized membrane protein
MLSLITRSGLAILGLVAGFLTLRTQPIEKQILAGSRQIPQDFPGMVELDLFQRGVELPDLEAARLSKSTVVSALAEELQSNGMTLAAVIGIAMLVAVLFSAWKMIQAFSEVSMPVLPGWVEKVIPMLAVVGLGVAVYLTYIEGTSAQAVCGPIGDCNAVQKSSYAKIFGLIPVGLIGALGYLAILAAWILGRISVQNSKALSRVKSYSPVTVWGMAFFGTLYSIYLTYLELFVIKAVCIWCLASAVIITLIMLAGLPACTNWLAGVEEE